MMNVREFYGNRIRVRACGLLFKNDAVLLIKHLIDGDVLWAPPGGEPEFGESLFETIKREFKEETLLDVIPGEFLFMTEHIKQPLHAIELFFKIDSYSGELGVGNDPEYQGSKVIEYAQFVNADELSKIGISERHKILRNCTNPIELLDKRGQL